MYPGLTPSEASEIILNERFSTVLHIAELYGIQYGCACDALCSSKWDIENINDHIPSTFEPQYSQTCLMCYQRAHYTACLTNTCQGYVCHSCMRVWMDNHQYLLCPFCKQEISGQAIDTHISEDNHLTILSKRMHRDCFKELPCACINCGELPPCTQCIFYTCHSCGYPEHNIVGDCQKAHKIYDEWVQTRYKKMIATCPSCERQGIPNPEYSTFICDYCNRECQNTTDWIRDILSASVPNHLRNRINGRENTAHVIWFALQGFTLRENDVDVLLDEQMTLTEKYNWMMPKKRTGCLSFLRHILISLNVVSH